MKQHPLLDWIAKHPIVTVLAILCVGIFISEQSTPPTAPAAISSVSSPAATPSKTEIDFQASVLGAKGLRRAMRNPDSFKLSQVLVMPDGASCYEYRAQNGFGGMNVEHAVLSPNGMMWTSDMEGFYRAWHRECAGKTGDDKTWEVGYAAGLPGMFSSE